jgi:hypothetical protein
MEVYRPVVTDSHHCDEGQEQNPIKVKSWIRIRIKVMRIRNPGDNKEIQGKLELYWS